MPRPKKPIYTYRADLGLYRKRIKDADGKYMDLYAPTPDELTRKVQTAQAAIAEAAKYAGNPLVREYGQRWVDTRTAGMKSKNAASYQDALRLHINPIIGDMRIQSVKPEDAERVVTAMTGKSSSLQSKVLRTLKGIFAAALDNDYIIKDPCTKLSNKGVRAKEKDALSAGQIETLLSAVKGTRAELFVLLGLYTGMRREEIMGLQWDCVHLDDPTPYIDVRRSLSWPSNSAPVLSDELKSDAAARNIPLPSILAEALRPRMAPPYELVIGGKPYTYTQFKNLWAIVQRRQTGERTYRKSRTDKVEKVTFTREAGQKSRGGNFSYTIDFKVTPHILRHTYITNLILSGADIRSVQYLAGHADPQVTLKIYTHIIGKQPSDLAAAVGKAFALPASESESIG